MLSICVLLLCFADDFSLTALTSEVSPTLAPWQDWRPDPSLHACSWRGELMCVTIVCSTWYVKFAEGKKKKKNQDGFSVLATAAD